MREMRNMQCNQKCPLLIRLQYNAIINNIIQAITVEIFSEKLIRLIQIFLCYQEMNFESSEGTKTIYPK
jgi:hypothetical protein